MVDLILLMANDFLDFTFFAFKGNSHFIAAKKSSGFLEFSDNKVLIRLSFLNCYVDVNLIVFDVDVHVMLMLC